MEYFLQKVLRKTYSRFLAFQYAAYILNFQIYICSPSMDAQILKEIIWLFLSNHGAAKGVLEAIFLNYTCDGDKVAEIVKKEALLEYPEKIKPYAEYHILRKMLYSSAKVTASYIAVVNDSAAKVLLTASSLHSKELFQQTLSSAVFLEMEDKQFMEKYVHRFGAASVAVTY